MNMFFGAKPRLTFLRGPFVSESELYPIELLKDVFDIRVIAAIGNTVDTELSVVEGKDVAMLLERIRGVQKLYRDVLDYALGDFHYMPDLEKSLKHVNVIDAPETFHYFTYQTARFIKDSDKKLVLNIGENTPFFRETNLKTRRIKQFVRDSADEFIALTEQCRNSLIAEGVDPERIEVIYGAVNTNLFFPTLKDPIMLDRLGLKEKDFVILVLGKLNWEKGVEDLLRAFRIVLNFNANISGKLKLLIMGDGREKKQLIRIVNSLEMEKHVVFGGTIHFSDMPLLYNLADVLVVPSKPYRFGQEPAARAIQQGMACGLPLVVTACGGNAELVGETGIVVPPADHFEMTEALQLLIHDEDYRTELGAKAHKRALEFFDANAVAAKRKSVYLKVLERE